MTVGRRVIAVFVLCGTCWGGLAVASLTTVTAQLRNSGWVTHSHEVLTTAHAARFDGASASRALTLFLFNGEERYVADFQRSTDALLAGVRRLGELTGDDPEQHARALKLWPLVEQRVASWRALLELRREQGMEQARAEQLRLDVAQGSVLRARFDELLETEERLLKARVTDAAAGARALRGLLISAMALGVLLMVGGGAYLTRSITRPVAALTLAAKAQGEHSAPWTLQLSGRDELATLNRAFQEMVERRNRVKAELIRANANLDAVIENLPSMVFMKDGSSLRFVRINRAGEKLLGLRRTELLGKSDADFFPPDEAAFFREKDLATLKGGEVVDIPEEPIQTAFGLRWLHTRKVPVGMEGGTTLLVGISEDITDRKLAEDALRAAKEAAEAANKELESFSYTVSHDLRAPLRAIDGFSLALLEDAGDKLAEDEKAHLVRVRDAARHMGELIDDLLKLARVSRAELKRERVDVGAMAKAEVENLRAEDPSREVELRLQGELTTEADAGLLRIALENLLRNAWKFSAKKPHTLIQVGREEGDAFYVADNGAGFDMSRAGRLFTPFQRLHRTQEFEGTGVGLATVERIVRRHGGRIWAEARPGEGATFRFTLGSTAARGPREP